MPLQLLNRRQSSPPTRNSAAESPTDTTPMPPKPQHRFTESPERLMRGGKAHAFNSPHARTFLIIGRTVVWSRRPHVYVINGLRLMENAKDLNTAKGYDFNIAGSLDEAALKFFKDHWTGVLGDTRRRHKAGRIWINVPDETGKATTFISFWGDRASIDSRDITALRDAFAVDSGVWVDWIDRPDSQYVRARGKKNDQPEPK